ncbi:MAG: DUF4376 domain-containing protein [Pseudomonas sp.]|uniref:DUF4376 domain-containing protein n=1 Tax=Pseudomonas sp. TaxID=306 RepID=UPI003D11986E
MRQVFAELGSSLQQFGGSCPDGWIVMQGERPSPEHVAQEDGSWALPDPDYHAIIAARRYEAEVGGITLNGVHIDTDDRSKLLINGAALEATFDPAYTMQWKTAGGFVELTGAQVIGVARAVRAHVQACFDREAELHEALEAGALTDEMLGQGWP